MITVLTYWAVINVGTKPGYEGEPAEKETVHKILREYCDKVGLGLTITETTFVYTGGEEPGYIIGLINYPRFPSSKEQIRTQAVQIAKILKRELKQERVSIVFPDQTIMLGEK